MQWFADDGAWLSPFAQQSPEQFEHDRSQRRRSWHILVHEQLFKLQLVNNTEHLKNFNEDDRTKTVTHTVRYTASAEQTVRRFFYGRRVGVYAQVYHMQLNRNDPARIHAISCNKLLLHKTIYLTVFSVVQLSNWTYALAVTKQQDAQMTHLAKLTFKTVDRSMKRDPIIARRDKLMAERKPAVKPSADKASAHAWRYHS
jgi:hypothetical protein